MLRIYLTNLGKYNEGELLGEWVDLPIAADELKEVLKRIGINEIYEEYFITDYDTNFGFSIDEYENLDELNEIAEVLDNLDDHEVEIIETLTENGYDIEESLELLENVMVYSNCNDMIDVAYQFVEECGVLDSIPEGVARYFDYESFARDMEIEGNYMFTNNGNCIQVL